MQILNYQFRFSLLGTIMAVLGIALFSALGTWQVFRALEKQQLQQEMQQKLQQPPYVLNNNPDSIEKRKFTNVEVTGYFDKKGEILIDNIKQDGKAGYHVLTPLKLANSDRVIIINRGWIPLGRDRRILPNIETPATKVRVKGMLAPPRSKPPLILGKLDTSSRVWLYYDTDAYAKKFNYRLLPLVVLQDKDDANGFVRKWPKYDAKVSMHVGYAIQWYVFALIVLATYIGINLRKVKQESENE